MVSVSVGSTPISVSVSAGGAVSVAATPAGSLVQVGNPAQPSLHEATHRPGGSDEITVVGRSVALYDSDFDIDALSASDGAVLINPSYAESFLNGIGAAGSNHSHSADAINQGTLARVRLPLATATAAGAVVVGSGLSVSAGTISASVVSVNGKTGAVYLSAYDVSAAEGDHTHGPIGSDGTVNGPMTFISDNEATGTINGGIAYFSSIVFPNLSSQSTAFTGSAGGITSGTLALARLPVTVEKASAVGNSGTSLTLSLATASVQTITLNGNCTFTMPTATAGASLTLLLTQGGSNTATFTGVKWPAGSAPTITATNGKVDVIRFVSDGTYWYGSISQNY